jgi:citrate lyase subunit beta / citryl-CoA lyase
MVRSWLYVPGDRPERFDKAIAKGADAVVLDLEDAVSLDRKSEARSLVANWVQQLVPGRVQIWVRVNQGPMGVEDCAAVAIPGLTGICVPKVDDPGELVDIDAVLTESEKRHGLSPGHWPLIPLIESAVGLTRLDSIVRADRVIQLQVGEVDLAADLGLRGDVDLHLAPIRSRILVESVAAGILAPIGPVSTEFRNLDAFRDSTRTVIGQGFVGRACIHPDQVTIVNEMCTPSVAERAEAQDLLERMESAVREGSGIALDANGRMIDEASARSARRIMALAEVASQDSN